MEWWEDAQRTEWTRFNSIQEAYSRGCDDALRASSTALQMLTAHATPETLAAVLRDYLASMTGPDVAALIANSVAPQALERAILDIIEHHISETL